jgi:hypothetical protein
VARLLLRLPNSNQRTGCGAAVECVHALRWCIMHQAHMPSSLARASWGQQRNLHLPLTWLEISSSDATKASWGS